MINRYKFYKYTKVVIPIRLNRNPGDSHNVENYIDFSPEITCQRNCYIGDFKIEELNIKHINKVRQC